MKQLISFILLAIFSSCAIMSESECENGDWSQYGRQDAMNGKPNSRFFERRKACYEHGIKGDENTYRQGYQEGLKNYCTFENGFEVGSRGEDYAKICPTDSHKELVRGHIIGKVRYEEKKRHEEFKKQVNASIQRNQEFRERAMGNNQRRMCTFDSDCVIRDRCNVKKCVKTSKTCTFDSDCNIEGSCSNRICAF